MISDKKLKKYYDYLTIYRIKDSLEIANAFYSAYSEGYASASEDSYNSDEKSQTIVDLKIRIEQLEAENLKLKKCVEFYADRKSYSVDCEAYSHGMVSHWILFGDSEELNDSVRHAGRRARQTLAEIKSEGV